jgi:(2R)-ethylmalonyl-CoA mutase
MGGAAAAIESGYMKQQLVRSHAARVAAIEEGRQVVVGVNRFTETEPSPLTMGREDAFFRPDPEAERGQIQRLQEFRKKRDGAEVKQALEELRAAAERGENIMPVSIRAAKAGVTTGEWADALRRVFGEYRPPTGIGGATARGRASAASIEKVRREVDALSEKLGRRLKILIGKPGLDGHSNGAEQIAVRARDAGMEVVYEGIRLTPERIVNSAAEEGVHVVGLSILSGSHLPLVAEVLRRLREADLGHVPVVVGGIIPPADADELRRAGVARVYTPQDFELNAMMEDIVRIAERALLSAV